MSGLSGPPVKVQESGKRSCRSRFLRPSAFESAPLSAERRPPGEGHLCHRESRYTGWLLVTVTRKSGPGMATLSQDARRPALPHGPPALPWHGKHFLASRLCACCSCAWDAPLLVFCSSGSFLYFRSFRSLPLGLSPPSCLCSLGLVNTPPFLCSTWCASDLSCLLLLVHLPLTEQLPSGGETCNVYPFREESPGPARCLVRGRSSTTLRVLPSLRGPGLCGCVSYLLLSTLGPGPGLLRKSSSGTPGRWTPEALGQAGLPGSGMECPVAFPALRRAGGPALGHVTSSKTPSAPEWGENHLCGALQRHEILRGRRSPRALCARRPSLQPCTALPPVPVLRGARPLSS